MGYSDDNTGARMGYDVCAALRAGRRGGKSGVLKFVRMPNDENAR